MLKSSAQKKFILAIETSCDDTCVAVIKNEMVSANVIISSAKIQATYGGVVPEVAARNHEKNIIEAFKKAMSESSLILADLDLIAYTNEPGLRVCLNVGEAFAHSLSTYLNVPLIKVNHLHGHIFSFWDMVSNIQYPFISLVASGGHTSIYLVNNCYELKLLNETQDDAVGECFDKIARELGLSYPGGPAIDGIYDETKANINFLTKLPRPDEQFSFSGLKTAVLNYINQKRMKHEAIDVVQIASSFQKQAINIIIDKLNYYVQAYRCNVISIGGGVSANRLLRKLINEQFNNITIKMPAVELSGDNAAMIGIYAKLIS